MDTIIYYFLREINVEWTSTITKYLKDQLNKLNDYHQSYSRVTTESEIPQKQWHYTVRLTDWLYEVNNSPLESLFFPINAFVGPGSQRS